MRDVSRRRLGSGVVVMALGLVLLAAVTSTAAAGASYGPVGADETLWSVAKKINAEQRLGTTAQLAWALFRANPQAFAGSPGRIRPGATLTVPPGDVVRAVDNADAYEALTGHKLPTPPSTASASPTAPPPSAAPSIRGIEVLPAVGQEKRQWLAVVGAGFRPGATLEFRELARQRRFAGRKPATVAPERIEYAAQFGRETGRWQVVVRNPDGQSSEPFEFEAGGNITVVLAPPPAPAAAVPTATAFERSAEQQAVAAMLQSGQGPEPAYQYLAALEAQYAGDVDYDYAYGTSALDSGRASEAVLILQRAVATKPRFAGARMELARAYYAVGDNESARREFTVLREQEPPAEAARVIAEYLDAIDRRAGAYQTQRLSWLEVGFGYDSNANGGPDTQSFLGFTLDNRNTSRDSGYYGATLGASVNHPLSPAWRALAQAQAGYRINPDAPFVNSQILRAATGLEWRPGRLQLVGQPSVTQVSLDTEDNHTQYAFDGLAAFDAQRARYSLNVRYAQQRYIEELEVQDVDTTLYGLAVQAGLGRLPVQVAAALTAGSDEPVDPLSPFARDLLGQRVTVVADLGRGHTLLLSAGTLESDYDAEFFGMVRSDEQFGSVLGYQYGGFRPYGWTLGAQLAYVDNRSTVELYDYDRLDAGLSFRREFK